MSYFGRRTAAPFGAVRYDSLYGQQEMTNTANEPDMPNLATETQIGGSHYKALGADQPIELCYRRYGYDPTRVVLCTKVDKYLTRAKGDPLENMQKAKHCIEMMIEFYQRSTA